MNPKEKEKKKRKQTAKTNKQTKTHLSHMIIIFFTHDEDDASSRQQKIGKKQEEEKQRVKLQNATKQHDDVKNVSPQLTSHTVELIFISISLLKGRRYCRLLS